MIKTNSTQSALSNVTEIESHGMDTFDDVVIPRPLLLLHRVWVQSPSPAWFRSGDTNNESGIGSLMYRFSRLLVERVGASKSRTGARLEGAKEGFEEGDADNFRAVATIVPDPEFGHRRDLCHIRQISPDIYIDDTVSKTPKVFNRHSIVDHVHINEVATDPQTDWLLFDADAHPVMTNGFEPEAGFVQKLCTERAEKQDTGIYPKVWSSNDQSSWTWFSAETTLQAIRIETEFRATTQEYSVETHAVEILEAVEYVSDGAKTPTPTVGHIFSTERTDGDNAVDTSLELATYTTSYDSFELLINPSSQSSLVVTTPVVAPIISPSPSQPSKQSVLVANHSQVIPATSTAPTPKEPIPSALTPAISQPQKTTLITSIFKTEFSPDKGSTTQAASTPAIFRLFYVSSVKTIPIFTMRSTPSGVILTSISKNSEEVSKDGPTTSTGTTSLISTDRMPSLEVLNTSVAAFTSKRPPDSLNTQKFAFSASNSSSMTGIKFSADLSRVRKEISIMKASSSFGISDSNRPYSATPAGNSGASSSTNMVSTIEPAPESMAVMLLTISTTVVSQYPSEGAPSQYSSLSLETPIFLKMPGASVSISKASTPISPDIPVSINTKFTATAMVESTTVRLSGNTCSTSWEILFMIDIPVFQSSGPITKSHLGLASNSVRETTSSAEHSVSLASTNKRPTSAHVSTSMSSRTEAPFIFTASAFPTISSVLISETSITASELDTIAKEKESTQLTSKIMILTSVTAVVVLHQKSSTTQQVFVLLEAVPSSSPVTTISTSLNISSINISMKLTEEAANGQSKPSLQGSPMSWHASETKFTRSIQRAISTNITYVKPTLSVAISICSTSVMAPTKTYPPITAVTVGLPVPSELPASAETTKTVPTGLAEYTSSRTVPESSISSSASWTIESASFQPVSAEELQPSDEVVAVFGIPSRTLTVFHNAKSPSTASSSAFHSDPSAFSSTPRAISGAPPPTFIRTDTSALNGFATSIAFLNRSSAAAVTCAISTRSRSNTAGVQASLTSMQIAISTGSRPSAGSRSFTYMTTSTSNVPPITAYQLGIFNELDFESQAPETLPLSPASASNTINLTIPTSPAGNISPCSSPPKEYPSPSSPTFEAIGPIEKLESSNDSSLPLSSSEHPLPEDVALQEPPSSQSSPAPEFSLPESPPELLLLPDSLPSELVEPEPLPEVPLSPNLLPLPESPPSDLLPPPESPPPELLPLPQPPSENSSEPSTPPADNLNQPGSDHGDAPAQPPLPDLREAANCTPPSPPIQPESTSPPPSPSPPGTSTATDQPIPCPPPPAPAPTKPLKGNTVFDPLTGEPIRPPALPFSSSSPSDPRPSLQPALPNAPYSDPSAGKFDIPSLKPVARPGGSAAGVDGGKGDGLSWKVVNSSHFDPWTGEHVHAGRG
ncbi:hypothetical protein MMC11_003603 [Xylographa trunciseda]|nr:hypothetical protein [Xylographa trunciseda]